MIPLRGLLVKDELWNNENGTIHIPLCLQEKFYVVLFRMDKVSDETLWVDQKDEGGGTPLDGPFIEAGFIRAREVATLDQKVDLGYDDPYKLRERQYHGHIEIKGYLGIRQASSPEVVVVEKVIQLSPVLDCIDHCSFSVHLPQVFLDVFFESDPPKKPVQKPA